MAGIGVISFLRSHLIQGHPRLSWPLSLLQLEDASGEDRESILLKLRQTLQLQDASGQDRSSIQLKPRQTLQLQDASEQDRGSTLLKPR
jgi:hypothetical protein